jgi:hypothetical protein
MERSRRKAHLLSSPDLKHGAAAEADRHLATAIVVHGPQVSAKAPLASSCKEAPMRASCKLAGRPVICSVAKRYCHLQPLYRCLRIADDQTKQGSIAATGSAPFDAIAQSTNF